MIRVLVDTLSTLLAGQIPVDTAYGLGEQRDTDQGRRPVVTIAGGQARILPQDADGDVSYWRVIGAVNQTRADIGEACAGIQWTFRLRLVYMLDRSHVACDNLAGRLGDIMIGLKTAARSLESTLQAVSVECSDVQAEVDTTRAASQEFPGLLLPLQKVLAYVDINVVVQGKEECFTDCPNLEYDPCADCECPPVAGCTIDVVIRVDGNVVQTLNGLDPCETQTYNVAITYS